MEDKLCRWASRPNCLQVSSSELHNKQHKPLHCFQMYDAMTPCHPFVWVLHCHTLSQIAGAVQKFVSIMCRSNWLLPAFEDWRMLAFNRQILVTPSHFSSLGTAETSRVFHSSFTACICEWTSYDQLWICHKLHWTYWNLWNLVSIREMNGHPCRTLNRLATCLAQKSVCV